MSTSSNYIFSSQNCAGARDAHKDLKLYLGDDAGLVVVPYFELPPYGERFDDTKGRFPQLKEVDRHFQETTGDTGSKYWFAQVLPKEEGGRIEYLAVYVVGYPKLFREFPTVSMRYIGILPS